MKLSIGIVGLPNVGKSTLFNALLKKQVADAANYPFCTIEPNVGIVEVPDERLPVLAKIVKTEKIVPAVVEFYDIAGIVKGASEGEGLGNKFLSHIREVAAIVHVVRLFEDNNVIHVANKVDPKSDIDVIDAELILADLETLKKQHEPKMNATKDERAAFEIIQRMKAELDKGISARNISLTDEEKALVQHLNLLTMKPIMYAFNVSEEQLMAQEQTKKTIETVLSSTNYALPATNYLLFNAKLENDVLAFTPSEQKEYLDQFQLKDTGLNRMIKKCYEILGLISFLTAGTLEARAWTIKKGELAPEAAGTIHTDFTKKFIKADICSYEDFVANEGWVKAREVGKVVSAGKDYVMKDGDVVEFKIGA
jgi:GTP-binding protein YchF